MIHLASPPPQTPCPVFQDGRGDSDPLPSYRAIAGRSFRETRLFRAATSCDCLVSGTFNPPTGVLFNVLSRYYCTIGLRTYLGLGDSGSQLHTGFLTHATRGGRQAVRRCAYGAFTLSGRTFQSISASVATADRRAHRPHPPPLSQRDSVCPLPSSIASTDGIACCFLFLPLLRCFNSGGSPSVREYDGKSHSGISGSTAACASPELIAACHALHQRS